MNTNQRLYDIISGPNRETIVNAFLYAYDQNSKIEVKFVITIGYTMPKNHPECAIVPMMAKDFRITELQHEDGSGYSFLIEGYCKADLKALAPEKATYDSYGFKAYYNAKSREGWIRFK